MESTRLLWVLLQGQLGKWWQMQDSLQLSCAPDRMVLQSHCTGRQGGQVVCTLPSASVGCELPSGNENNVGWGSSLWLRAMPSEEHSCEAPAPNTHVSWDGPLALRKGLCGEPWRQPLFTSSAVGMHFLLILSFSPWGQALQNSGWAISYG